VQHNGTKNPRVNIDLFDEADTAIARDDLKKRVRNGVDGILCLLTEKMDSEIMQLGGKRLKVISNCAVGVDNIDIPEATRRGIPVGNTPGILTDTTADFAFALLMSSARRVVEADRHIKEGKWKTWGLTTLLGQDVSNATIGVVGFGRIGQGMAQRCAGFNMKVLFIDAYDSPEVQATARRLNATRVSTLEELLPQCDFVSLHCPYNKSSHHLMNDKTLSMMKNTAILINTARGACIDGKALVRACKTGVIAGAALDVTEKEPIDGNDELLTLPNVIIAPHIASGSVRTREKMAHMAIDNLLAGITGKPLPTPVDKNCVQYKPKSSL
jgi:glyoxylate reductase